MHINQIFELSITLANEKIPEKFFKGNTQKMGYLKELDS